MASGPQVSVLRKAPVTRRSGNNLCARSACLCMGPCPGVSEGSGADGHLGMRTARSEVLAQFSKASSSPRLEKPRPTPSDHCPSLHRKQRRTCPVHRIRSLCCHREAHKNICSARELWSFKVFSVPARTAMHIPLLSSQRHRHLRLLWDMNESQVMVPLQL